MLLKSFKQLFNKPKIKSSAWDAAGSGRRFFHFQPESGSINNLLSQNLETLRSRSRDMVRKNPYAANIIDTIVSIALFTIIQTNHNMLLAYYSHKHIFSLFGLL